MTILLTIRTTLGNLFNITLTPITYFMLSSGANQLILINFHILRNLQDLQFSPGAGNVTGPTRNRSFYKDIESKHCIIYLRIYLWINRYLNILIIIQMPTLLLDFLDCSLRELNHRKNDICIYGNIYLFSSTA